MKKKEIKYRTTVDFDAARMYADSNCKYCHGVGYLKTQIAVDGGTIRKNQPTEMTVSYCTCVRKNSRKYL